MKSVFSGLADVSPPDPAKPPLTSWYTPGLSDALGDRLLLFDNTTSSPLELLRFKPEFSRAPGFEAALRDRVEELASFEHESLATVRAVRWLDGSEGLTLVSNQIVGRRLSELLGDVRGTGLALELIRQLSPVLAALHERGIAHGVLTPERIVITPDGRVVLCEHVLGSALDGLNLPSGWLRTELGLAVPGGDARVLLDGRSDVVQLGFIALSLGLGQRLHASAYPEAVGRLIDEGVASGALPPGLRRWLDRALHLVWPPFASALEATAALDELPESAASPRPQSEEEPEPGSGTTPSRLTTPRNVIALRPIAGKSARLETKPTPASRITEPPKPSEPPTMVPVNAPVEPFFPDEMQMAAKPSPPPPDADERRDTGVDRSRPRPRHAAGPGTPDVIDFTTADRELSAKPASVRPTAPSARAQKPRRQPADAATAGSAPAGGAYDAPNRPQQPVPPDDVDVIRTTRRGDQDGAAAPVVMPPVTPVPSLATIAGGTIAREAPRRRRFLDAKWFTVAALIVAVAEAAIIAGLLYTGFASGISSGGSSTVATSDAATAPAQDVRSSHGSDSAAAAAKPSAPPSAQRGRPAGAARTGTVQFTSPAALDVFQNGARIGSTTDPIALPAGRHTLEVVSEPLGYRTTQTVTIVAGRNVARGITLPQGRVNINASPWAHVSIAGRALGDTPLANVALPIGSHEVVFSHPVFGEVRRTAVVRADGVTRVSANMQER